MKSRIGIVAATLLLAASLPLAAQERPAPPGPPSLERLEHLRLERLKESLDLTEEQTATLRQQLDRSHEAMRQSFDRQRAAIDALEKSLADEPIDQEALRRALTDVEAAREQMEREREQHMAELGRTLTLEQRAKFLLFNRQFDSRLRELVERHRGPGHGGHDRRAMAPERREATREQKIEFLEKRIAEMQEELEELRSGDD